MMTILPTANIEKRSFDSLSETTEETRNSSLQTNDTESGSKRIKKMDTKSNDLINEGEVNVNESNTQNTSSFSAKMIVQLAKSAMGSLDESSQKISGKSYNESPINSLAYSISLPKSHPKSLNSHSLSLILAHLTTEIAKFDNSGALPLLQSILKIDWIYYSSDNENFSKHYATFLTVLVTSIPSWWGKVATKIVQDFIKNEPNQLPSHHETLKKLISLAPTAAHALPNLLKFNFPNKNGPKDEIVNYVKNLLFLTEYYNVMVNYVWNLIFENFIKLDVQFQNQIDEIDDDDLAEALGLDESDDESNDEDEDVDSIGSASDNDSDEDRDRSADDDDEDEDEDADADADADKNDDDGSDVEGVNLKIVEDMNMSDEEEEDNKKSNIIKKVTFSKNDSSDKNGDQNEEEFDDEMLDSEAEYEVELESLSDFSNKLDLFLSTLLEYLQPGLSVQSLESGNGIQIFNSLTKAFCSLVLPTHGTKATQYIIFHAAQQQPELMDAFLVTLFEIVFNGDKRNSSASGLAAFSHNSNTVGNLNNRITGIQYIASFVARAKNLSKQQLASVVTFLVDYCTAYMEENEDDDSQEIVAGRSSSHYGVSPVKPDFNPNKHMIFYSLIQALMYIVCFRKDELRLSEDSDVESSKTGWIAQLDRFFTRAVVSKYNPLRWCNETVVLIFSRVAQSEGICYTWSVIERIKRERVGKVYDKNDEEHIGRSASATINISVGTQSSMRATQEFLDLVAFFPFDPLLLKVSRKIVEGNYVDWQNDDEDNDDSEI